MVIVIIIFPNVRLFSNQHYLLLEDLYVVSVQIIEILVVHDIAELNTHFLCLVTPPLVTHLVTQLAEKVVDSSQRGDIPRI